MQQAFRSASARPKQFDGIPKATRVVKFRTNFYPSTRFLGLREYLEEETTVAIDGQIHETAYFQRLEEDAEVYFLPKIEAG